MKIARKATTEPSRAALEERLRRRALELRGEIDRALHDADPAQAGLANRYAEGGDDAVTALARDLDAASVERDGAELREVEEALLRIRDGTYGVCVDCGDPIAPRRLDALPQARRCAGCEGRAESEADGSPPPSL